MLVKCFSFTNLHRYDPCFMSPQVTPKRHTKHNGLPQKLHNDTLDHRYHEQYNDFVDLGAQSDESVQPKGCFFKVQTFLSLIIS